MNLNKSPGKGRRIEGGSDATPHHFETVRLDGDLLRLLIAERLPSGTADILDRWPLINEASASEEMTGPHRSTMHRWAQGQVPRTTDHLLRLCSILDVDPLCLLKLPEDNPDAALERLTSAYIHGRWQPPALEFLKEFLGRRAIWPPIALAREYYRRDWCVRELTHHASQSANYYATFRITTEETSFSGGPFVYHIAFRHESLFNKRWLQYGVVIRHGTSVSLRHINGYAESCSVSDGNSPTMIQTWMGPSSAVFRIACLHKFELGLDQSTTSPSPCVRFPG